MVELYAAFLFGLLGSLHCIGMCGPIVLAYSLPLSAKEKARRVFWHHLFYHFGRVTTYGFLGAVAGGIGSQMYVVGDWVGAGRIVLLIFGLVLLAVAIVLAGGSRLFPWLSFDFVTQSAMYKQTVGKLMVSSAPASKYALGLLLGFLPCHLIYAMLIQAAAFGSIRTGFLMMVCFGAGMVPALMGIGFASQIISLPVRRWGERLVTASLVILAVTFLLRSVGYNAMHFGHPPMAAPGPVVAGAPASPAEHSGGGCH